MEKSFPLDELVDLEELQSIQDSFARAAGISSVILSPEGEPLTRFTNPTGFCSLIQSTGKGKERCFRSFMEMGKIALGTQEPEICYCFVHGGHFVAPIMIDGKHKGTMFAGQFIPEKFSSEQLHDLKEIAVEIDLDPGLLVKEAENMRVVRENVIRNYSSLLFKIVGTISRRGAQAAELSRVNDALQRAHDGLEKRVQKRTAELAEANKELKYEITERKLAKEDLRLHAAMMDNVSEGVYLIGLDDLLIKWTNEIFTRMFGYDPGEMIGKHVDIVNAPTERTPAETRISIMDVLKETREWQGEVRNIKRDGTHLWCYANVSLFDHPEYGKVIMSVNTDITKRKEAEETLRESEEKFRLLSENSIDCIWIVNTKLRFTYLSSSVERMMGFKPEQWVGTKLSSHFKKKEFLKAGLLAVKAIKNYKTFTHVTFETKMLNSKNDEVDVEISSKVLLNSQGKLIGLQGITRDITERKKAEKILKDSKIKLQLLYDSSSDAIMLLDEKGFFDCNEATLRLFGCANREEFCSRHPADFSPPTQPDGTDSISYAGNKIAVALKEGSQRFEYLHRRLDGTDFPAEVLLDAFMLEGKKVLQARVYDITEQKAAQKAIRESEERYRSLFEFGMDGILIADIETKRFKYANPALCKMLGYSAKELKRMSISDIHPKDNFEYVISVFEAQARGEKILAQYIPCLRKNGTIIYADINTTVALVDGKKCNIGFFRDTTERKTAEEEIKKKTDELEKFNKLAVGRELKMIKLKKEINALLEKSGKEPGYKIVGKPQAEVF